MLALIVCSVVILEERMGQRMAPRGTHEVQLDVSPKRAQPAFSKSFAKCRTNMDRMCGSTEGTECLDCARQNQADLFSSHCVMADVYQVP